MPAPNGTATILSDADLEGVQARLSFALESIAAGDSLSASEDIERARQARGAAPAKPSRRAGRAPLRAIGYVRVSTRGQAERGMGLASQRGRITEFTAHKGWELLRFAEEAASGAVRAGEETSDEHRPILQALIEAAAVGSYDVLVVARLDRLSRDYASLTLIERRLQRFGVEVVSTAEENGDGAVAEFIRGQLALVAQLERSLILDRVNAGKAKRKAEGRHVHGRIPDGYRTVAAEREAGAAGRQLEPVEEGAAVLRRIFDDIRAGDSPGRVAKALNAESVPSPEGAAWRAKAITRIVTNPAYAGERYGIKKAHKPIVSRRVFNAANAALAERAARWAHGRSESSTK